MDGTVASWGDHRTLSRRFGVSAFRTFASSAQCERPAKPRQDPFANFRNSFTPKYDIAKPTYAKWASTGLRLGIPQHGFAAILAKRAFIHGYIAFASEMMIQLETQEAEYNEGLEPDPIDWEGIWFQIKRTGPDIWYGTLREWVTEGIRIFYERHAYEAWDRRTVWKFLKTPSMSACRKMCRSGARGLAGVLWTILRGDLLQYAADATVRALLLPIRMRYTLLKSPRPPAKDILRVGVKHAALEGACVVTRFVTTATATTVIIGTGFFVSVKLRGQKQSVSQYDNDSQAASTLSMGMCLGVGTLVGDVVENIVRGSLASVLNIDSPGPLAPITFGPPGGGNLGGDPDVHPHAA